MSLTVTPEQAAANALATWLGNVLPGIAVEPRWPDPAKAKPLPSVSIVMAGEPELIFCVPETIGTPVLVSSGVFTYRWKVAQITQRYSVDIWAAFDLDRDDILNRARLAFIGGNVPQGDVADPYDPSISVAIQDGWAPSCASFYIDGHERTTWSDAAQTNGYRASLMLVGDVVLTKDAASHALATAQIKAKIDGALAETITVTSTTATFSQGS